jgi:mitogen-activated protein kinase 15
VGKGTYGIVYKARHKKSNRVIAIKKIIDAFQNLIDAKRTYRELNYLLQMDHPCIVRLEYLLHLNRKGMFN